MTGVGHNSGESAIEQRHVVTVSLPTALVRLFPGSPNQVQIEARNVLEVVDGLEQRWPGMRDRLTDSRPSIRKHLNIFVGGDKARLDTPVTAGTRVTILTAMSGG
ncbi:MAG: MoaD/ThiS family protein [Alphaproteobacteria bacterium]|nr:MoaD/ThiS family protein [Alphaproteobacteria bacterium]